MLRDSTAGNTGGPIAVGLVIFFESIMNLNDADPEIEIVTHCWSGPEVPIYHLMLQLQMSSLLTDPPDCITRLTVCYTKTDRNTAITLGGLAIPFKHHKTLQLKLKPMSSEMLFRRSIGRHEVGFETQAKVVWFTDVDYLFYKKSVQQALEAALRSDADLVYPETVYRHRDHTQGDELLRHVELMPASDVIDKDVIGLKKNFEPHHYRRAIGGIQIVKGDLTRKIGYANKRNPVTDSDHFQKCRGDIDFRKAIGSKEKVEIDGVYRIRHSRCGRDQGQIDHSKGSDDGTDQIQKPGLVSGSTEEDHSTQD